MEFQIDNKLVENLCLKKLLLKEGNKRHENIRPLLLFLSGGMRGVSGAGVTFAFNILGLQDIFDVVAGVSTGAGNAAYFLGGLEQSYVGGQVYYDNLAKHFIHYTKRPIADVDYVEQVIKNSDKKIDYTSVANSRTNFVVAVTNYKTGKGELIDVKKATPHMASAIKASIAMLGLYNFPVVVNNIQYIDGCIALPFPIKSLIEKFNPTDVLIVTNCSADKIRNKNIGLIERMLMNVIFNKSPEHLKTLGLTRRLRFIEEYEYFKDLKGVNKGIIWNDNDVGLLTTSEKKLKKVFYKSSLETLDFFHEIYF